MGLKNLSQLVWANPVYNLLGGRDSAPGEIIRRYNTLVDTDIFAAAAAVGKYCGYNKEMLFELAKWAKEFMDEIQGLGERGQAAADLFWTWRRREDSPLTIDWVIEKIKQSRPTAKNESAAKTLYLNELISEGQFAELKDFMEECRRQEQEVPVVQPPIIDVAIEGDESEILWVVAGIYVCLTKEDARLLEQRRNEYPGGPVEFDYSFGFDSSSGSAGVEKVPAKEIDLDENYPQEGVIWINDYAVRFSYGEE